METLTLTLALVLVPIGLLRSSLRSILNAKFNLSFFLSADQLIKTSNFFRDHQIKIFGPFCFSCSSFLFFLIFVLLIIGVEVLFSVMHLQNNFVRLQKIIKQESIFFRFIFNYIYTLYRIYIKSERDRDRERWGVRKLEEWIAAWGVQCGSGGEMGLGGQER